MGAPGSRDKVTKRTRKSRLKELPAAEADAEEFTEGGRRAKEVPRVLGQQGTLRMERGHGENGTCRTPKADNSGKPEKYHTMAAFRHEEHAREMQEANDARASDEQADLENTMLQLQRERELAVSSLEHTRMNQQFPIPDGQHLAA